jgi:hypothetical protein
MPKAWLSRSGFPDSGILTVRYTSETNLERKTNPMANIRPDSAQARHGSVSTKPKYDIDKKTATRLQKKFKEALKGRSAGELFRCATIRTLKQM